MNFLIQRTNEELRLIDEQLKKFPYLLKDEKLGFSGGVHVAKNIRIELKRNFPETKFKVISSYISVDITWEGYPEKPQISEIVLKHEDHEWDESGDIRRVKQSIFNKAFGGCKYISLRKLRPSILNN